MLELVTSIVASLVDAQVPVIRALVERLATANPGTRKELELRLDANISL